MGSSLSPESEGFLAELVAQREYEDRDAALEEAVALLRRRRKLLNDVNAGVEQLQRGESRRYEADELQRFLADVEARSNQIRPPE